MEEEKSKKKKSTKTVKKPTVEFIEEPVNETTEAPVEEVMITKKVIKPVGTRRVYRSKVKTRKKIIQRKLRVAKTSEKKFF